MKKLGKRLSHSKDRSCISITMKVQFSYHILKRQNNPIHDSEILVNHNKCIQKQTGT